MADGAWANVKEETCVPVPSTLVAPTLTVPLPAGTTTLAEVAVAESTWAAAPPKLIVACSSPRPEMVTVDPLPPGVTEDTSGHERPPASGEPIPVAASYPTVAAKAPPLDPVMSVLPLVMSVNAVP